MRKLLTVPVIVAIAIAVAGCDWQTFKAQVTNDAAVLEAKVAAFIAKVKTNAPIALAEAQAIVGVACSLVPVVQAAESALVSNVSGLSDSAQATLATATVYENKASAACTTYNATQASAPTPSAAINTTLSVWNAYISAKAQVNAAQAKIVAGK